MHFRVFLYHALQDYFGFPNMIPEGGSFDHHDPLDLPLLRVCMMPVIYTLLLAVCGPSIAATLIEKDVQ